MLHDDIQLVLLPNSNNWLSLSVSIKKVK